MNELGFHNHIVHTSLALWALGASGPVINAMYGVQTKQQRPLLESPEPITAQNLHDHLGDAKFYPGYLKFFTQEVLDKGAVCALEEYVYSKKANFIAERDDKSQPEMMSRSFQALLHPMIHCGYGLEFGLPGVMAEGLAQTAVHPAGLRALIPPSLWDESQSGVDSLVNALPALALNAVPSVKPPAASGVHAFTIMSRILDDPRFAVEPAESGDRVQMIMKPMMTTLETQGDALHAFADEWISGMIDSSSMEKKIEEISWMNILIYGIGGWKESREFRADFPLLHIVTPLIFLPSYAAYLKPSSMAILIKSYFTLSLTWWIARGRPVIDIHGFYASTSANPTPPGPHPTPSSETLPSPSHAHAVTPNSFLPLIQSAMVHPDDHLCKLQRTLAHLSCLYGRRSAGEKGFAETELKGAELLDGTLFRRVGGLSADRMGWLREGGKMDTWNVEGFFD